MLLPSDPTSESTQTLIREHGPYVNRCNDAGCSPLMIMDKRKVLPYVRSVDTAAATKALDALAAQRADELEALNEGLARKDGDHH